MKNWVNYKLKEVCNKITDGSHNPPRGIDSSDFIMISSKNIFDDSIHYEDPRYLTQTDFESENKRTEVKYNDVLLTIVGTIGRVAVVPINHPKFTLQRSVAVLKIKENILDSRFLMFSLQNILKFLTEESRGVAQKGIYLNQLREIEIPIPTLLEQQRIVSILDQAFAAIDKAKANAEKNLKNAKELFESYLLEVFEKKGEGWEERTLKEIGIAQTGMTPKTSDTENFGDFIPFIKPADIDFNGDGSLNYNKDGLSEKGLSKARKISKGSTLMVCIGATIGKVGFSDRDITCNQQINSLTVKRDFDSKFIYYTLSSKSFFDQVLINSAQATLPIINKGKWESLKINFPKSKEEQANITKKLDLLKNETKKLEYIYSNKINDLAELKKSILEKAFSGQLSESEFSGLEDVKDKKTNKNRVQTQN